MRTITARNVNDAYVNGMLHLKMEGVEEDSRNGKVKVAPGPVCTTYHCPYERVLFDGARDANPFFHLAECIWILSGSRYVEWIAQFNKQMRTYSDNGVSLYGAYGYRMREMHGDQLTEVIHRLTKDPKDRRCVISLHSPFDDITIDSKDIPCNTHLYFRTRGRELEMTVLCRSNDAVWGAYGANAVHFSFIHEFIARAVGLGQGRLHQFSNNFHIYEHHWPLMERVLETAENPYEDAMVWPAMMDVTHKNWGGFLEDCEDIVLEERPPSRSEFLKQVFVPMMDAYLERDMAQRLLIVGRMIDCDWKLAASKWLRRRLANQEMDQPHRGHDSDIPF